MKKISDVCLGLVASCMLIGCGSLEHRTTPDNPSQTSYPATFHISLEREVQVDMNNPDADSEAQKLTETLRFVCRVQPLSGRDGRYRVAFEEVSARRTDFLHHTTFTDAVDGLDGRTFEIHVDETGQIIKADTLREALKTLARGCETCPQDHDCGQRKVKEQNFLLDVWSIQELLFRAARASQNPAQADGWVHTRQLPSVLPGKAPFVITEWSVNTDNTGSVIASGHETLDSNPVQNSLPELFHPHIRPKGLLGYLRNCTYDVIKGHIALEAEVDTGRSLQITREAVMNATAYFTLSRPPQRPSITVWDTLKIEQQ